MKYKTEDLRIRSISDVIPPAQVHDEMPITEPVAELVHDTRQSIHRILHGEDDRLLVVMGPCSIHDPKAARDYASRLKQYRDELSDRLLVVMRVYFEKPRTTVGWKGLINDPDLDGSFNINKGLRIARELLLDLNTMGVPAGTEFLDLVTPQYITDLISLAGGRSVTSDIETAYPKVSRETARAMARAVDAPFSPPLIRIHNPPRIGIQMTRLR